MSGMPMLNMIIGYGYADYKSPKKRDIAISYASLITFFLLAFTAAELYWHPPFWARVVMLLYITVAVVYYTLMTRRLILLKVPRWVTELSIAGLVANFIFVVVKIAIFLFV